jgi:hypothetical protein
MNETKYKNFFTDLVNASPYIKIAAEGSAGTGKTWTLALIAVGIHKRIGSTKPIVVFDTEKSAKFLRRLFADNNIEAVVKESRTLADLSLTMNFCAEGNADILIIDSITHVYENYLEAYKKTKGRAFLQFQDWGTIKPTWRAQFSEKLVAGPYHVLFTGREGYVYEQILNEDTNKKELVKTGVKMRAEGDTAYEPDLLLRMERWEELLDEQKKIWRTATVVKGRGDLCDGMVIKNPTFEDFSPFIEFVLGDVKPAVQTESFPDSTLVAKDEDFHEDRTNRKVLLERNAALIDEVAAGSSGAAKAMKLSLMKYAYYGETSETAITALDAPHLEEANRRLNDVVPLVKRIIDGEKYVYPVAKAIEAARVKYLGAECTEDIVAAGLELLTAYRDHLKEKYRLQRDGAAGPKQDEGGSSDTTLKSVLALIDEHKTTIPQLITQFPRDLLERLSPEELKDVETEIRNVIGPKQDVPKATTAGHKAKQGELSGIGARG